MSHTRELTNEPRQQEDPPSNPSCPKHPRAAHPQNGAVVLFGAALTPSSTYPTLPYPTLPGVFRGGHHFQSQRHSLEVLEAHDIEVVEPLGVTERVVETPKQYQLVSPHHHAVPAPGRGCLSQHVQLLPGVRLEEVPPAAWGRNVEQPVSLMMAVGLCTGNNAAVIPPCSSESRYDRATSRSETNRPYGKIPKKRLTR